MYTLHNPLQASHQLFHPVCKPVFFSSFGICINALQCLLDTVPNTNLCNSTTNICFVFSVKNSSFVFSHKWINCSWISPKNTSSNQVFITFGRKERWELSLFVVWVFFFYIKIDSLEINAFQLWIFNTLTWKRSHKIFPHKATWSHLKFHYWKPLSVYSERLPKLKPAENNIRRIKANFSPLCPPSLTVW